MTEKKIIVIEPTVSELTSNSTLELRKKRVCAYARVSTDLDEQLNSYKTQINEFTSFIKSREDWEFVKMYSDEGISGTSVKKRLGFLEMINDAKAGKIDLILTKSLSRFARNTVDALTIIREMRDINVDIYFEKENLYSSDSKVDFLITIFSSIAQEESRNVSENVKWGVRKGFKEGRVKLNWNIFLGYEKNEDGLIVINEDEATTVKMIYNLYLSGKTYRQIKDELITLQRKNGKGSFNWNISNICNILSNEKYCGDAILQKTIVVDYLTHRSVANDGIADKYYIKDNHPAIISRDLWNLVQTLKENKNEIMGTSQSTKQNKYPLSGKIFCLTCGRSMQRSKFTVNRNTKTSRIALTCKKRSRVELNKVICNAKPIDNELMEIAIVYAMKDYSTKLNDIADELISILKNIDETGEISTSINNAKLKVIELENFTKKLIKMRVEGCKDYSDDDLSNLYLENKQELTKQNELIKDYELQLVKNHKNTIKLEQIKEMIDNKESMNHIKLFADKIAKIIIVSNEEIVICIEDTKFTDEGFLENMNNIINYSHIVKGTYYDKKTQKSLKYKVVKVGDEIDE